MTDSQYIKFTQVGRCSSIFISNFEQNFIIALMCLVNLLDLLLNSNIVLVGEK